MASVDSGNYSSAVRNQEAEVKKTDMEIYQDNLPSWEKALPLLTRTVRPGLVCTSVRAQEHNHQEVLKCYASLCKCPFLRDVEELIRFVS